MITSANVHLDTAWKTPQFWLIWGVLCLNVTAGIGVISMASPMLQDVFGARLVGVDTMTALTAAQRAAIVASAAGLVGLISLFNALGRIFWASLSDHIGRKTMYYAIFLIGIVLYGLLPTWGHLGLPIMFVLSICIILSMYGGGFSTVPAYLADIFGTEMVGAIHGRLITAWSVAGVAGPALIAGIRQFQIDHGVPHNHVYDVTLYLMALLLFCGLVCNFFIKPVHEKHHATDDELARGRDPRRGQPIAPAEFRPPHAAISEVAAFLPGSRWVSRSPPASISSAPRSRPCSDVEVRHAWISRLTNFRTDEDTSKALFSSVVCGSEVRSGDDPQYGGLRNHHTGFFVCVYGGAY